MREIVLDGITYELVAKAKGEVDTRVDVLKAAAPQQYTLGLAYPALKAPGRGADGYNDFSSPEVLEKCAWEYMTKHREINMFHKGGTEGHAEVVESYIYRGPDWLIESPVDGSTYVIKAGDWMLGTVWDDHGWQMVEDRLIRGWSPEGGAARTTPSPERLALLRS